MYDLIIVGGGPAGLTAALYARRANKNVLVIEKDGFGGQIAFSPKVENIPGFKTIQGVEFADLLTDQVIEQGADMENLEVLSVEECGEGYKVVTDDGDFEGLSVIIATRVKELFRDKKLSEKYSFKQLMIYLSKAKKVRIGEDDK